MITFITVRGYFISYKPRPREARPHCNWILKPLVRPRLSSIRQIVVSCLDVTFHFSCVVSSKGRGVAS
jgi:hypothetical protein